MGIKTVHDLPNTCLTNFRIKLETVEEAEEVKNSCAALKVALEKYKPNPRVEGTRRDPKEIVITLKPSLESEPVKIKIDGSKDIIICSRDHVTSG
jgi:hypothetical protein